MTYLKTRITPRKGQGLRNTGKTNQTQTDGMAPATPGSHLTVPNQIISPKAIINTEKGIGNVMNSWINKPSN